MRRLIALWLATFLFLLGWNAFAQVVNPQSNFAAQVQQSSPSMWLNYNDLTASFKDGVGGLSFGNTAPATPTYVTQCTVQPASASTISCNLTANAGDALVIGVSLRSTTITAVTDSAGCTPSAVTGSSWVNGTNIGAAYICSNVAAGAHTLTITMSASSSYPLLIVQDFANVVAASPVDGTGSGAFTTTGTSFGSGSMTTTTPNDILVGFGVSYNYVQVSSGSPVFTLEPGVNTVGAHLLATSPGSYAFNLNLASGSTGGGAFILALKPATITSPTTPQKPGFDNTNPSNYSAGFPYNGFSIAPNNTLGAIDWNSPWSMLIQFDTLNWNRTGTLVLASKGDISSVYNNWWKLILKQTVTPGGTQVCFVRNGETTSAVQLGNQNCTTVDIANGYNYDVLVTDTGAGTGAALQFYVNGTGPGALPQVAASNSYQFGFGAVNLTISGGTGYTASTTFTSSGGGAKCTVSGSIPESGGVPTAGVLAESNFNNYDAGCTSIPTIVLGTQTGTGLTVTASLAGGSMNDTNYPVMAPGYVNAGTYSGIDQSDSTQTSTYVDEFATWNRALTPTEIYNIFVQTKFYQSLLPAVPAHIPVILGELVCADYDATTTVAVAIKLHQLGYINLLGIAIEQDSASGGSLFRQMLDQAGLNNVPIGFASNVGAGGSASAGFCNTANIAAYNANTSLLTASYPSTSQMMRKIFAAHPTTGITLLMPTTLYGTYDFMTSAADSISSLTGTQLWAQNVTNGGSMYVQGGSCDSSTLPATTPCLTSDTGSNILFYPTQGQYVTNNLAGLPTYWLGGTPAANGPGALYTRTSKDPLYLVSATYGNDGRTGWDSLGTMMMLGTPPTYGGVQIGYSGGTGYANDTAFTSTGGGPNCHVTGYMTAASGVPNGIQWNYGTFGSVSTYATHGHGCTSAPTIVLTAPTGTGVTLTAYPSIVCMTYTITQPSGTWTETFDSTTCNKEYAVPYSDTTVEAASGKGAPIYKWLMNSLENPVPVGQPRAQ